MPYEPRMSYAVDFTPFNPALHSISGRSFWWRRRIFSITTDEYCILSATRGIILADRGCHKHLCSQCSYNRRPTSADNSSLIVMDFVQVALPLPKVWSFHNPESRFETRDWESNPETKALFLYMI